MPDTIRNDAARGEPSIGELVDLIKSVAKEDSDFAAIQAAGVRLVQATLEPVLHELALCGVSADMLADLLVSAAFQVKADAVSEAEAVASLKATLDKLAKQGERQPAQV